MIILLVILSILSGAITISAGYDLFRIIYVDLAQKKIAKEKYLVEGENLSEEYFYTPQIFWKEVLMYYIPFILPVINLMFYTWFLLVLGYRTTKKFLNSPVVPW